MFLLLMALAAALAQAAPNLIYPLTDQQPPVARVGKLFVFDLVPSTFTSKSDITYTTSSLLAWLQFDTSTQVFHGTPSLSDAGESLVTLTAKDGSGSTTSSFTLITTNFSAPSVHASFSTQISNPPLREFASATALAGGAGVSVPPYWSFSLGFAYDTFRTSYLEPTNGQLYFAAHQRGMAGLPSWLHFNPDSFTFSGVAPGNGSYTIVATGTDFWGYTGAQTSFMIQVGEGEAVEVAKGVNLTDVVTMARSQVEYKVDLGDLTLGGTPVAAGQVVCTLDNTAVPWLRLDSTTNTITGTTPDEYLNGTVIPLAVPLMITPTDSNNTLALTTWLGIEILPSFFKTFSIPNVTAKPTQPFSFSLTPYLNTNSTTINATISPNSAVQWLVWHAENLTLAGIAPKNPQYNEVDVVFEATMASPMLAIILAAGDTKTLTSTTDLKITMAGVTASASGTSGAASATGSPSTSQSGPDFQSGSKAHGGLSKGGKIALAVVFGLLGLVLLLLLLLFCCRRRKTKTREREKDDADSFVAGSPIQDPFRRSNGLEPPRNLLGEIARFSGFHLRHGSEAETTVRPTSAGTGTTAAENPRRLDGLKGIFGWSDEKEKELVVATPKLGNSSTSFLGSGDVIGVNDLVNRPSQDASSFTQTFSSSGSSRASWESQRSFRWSSAENEGGMRNRESTAPSIARPRENFTPRYPRNASPTALARLTSQHTLEASPEFSEFGSQEGEHSGTGTQVSESLFGSGSNFPSGPSGLGRFGDSGFKSIDEDDEDSTSVEGPAVVSMAERQSFETRQPHATEQRPVPRLRSSKERILSHRQPPATEHSRHALAGSEEGVYDDADEARRSTVYAPSEANGLGYPASSIFFGTPNPDAEFDQRSSVNPSEARSSTIRAIPSHVNPLSPPLPQVGSFIRHRRTNTSGSGGGSRPGSGINDGRLRACANETFSIHPQIHPPPTVSLSAATWSSNPPSTYRAEVQGGGALPAWLHFDARELELWGVPSLKYAGETTVLRIIEKMPNNNRRSDPLAFGYEPPQERDVGRLIIEVVDRLRSPQFALDASPHAL